MKNRRSISELRNSLEGKVYVRCKSGDVFRRFLEDAEAEGYMIGDSRPTEAGVSWDIKAIGQDRTISNVGIAGHIACQAGGPNIHIIDYGLYADGEKDYEVKQL